MMVNVRRIALQTLMRMQAGSGYSNLSLDAAIKKHQLDGRDRGLLTQLVMGVEERQTTLDYYIAALAGQKQRTIEPEVQMILRLGLYQLMFCDRIPAHAAVSETVSLCPSRARGFVNALLRGYMRRGEEIALPRDEVENMSVVCGFPEAICRVLCRQYGVARTRSMLEAMNRPPRLTLRVNTLRVSREELMARLVREGHSVAPTPYADTGILLSTTSVSLLPGFSEGDFTVQDEASQLCTAALGAQAGMRVVDVCSAPGSKSFGAAMDMKNSGEILAFDLHDSKLSLIRSGGERLGIDIIRAAAADGRSFIPELEETAHRIICDVPCSGYGVMAKKPEIRHKHPDASARLPEIQYDILENSCRYLRRGGVLVYSTCTLLDEENDGVIDRFLAAHPEFCLEGFRAGGLEAPEGRVTLAPDTHGTDGFYIARLIRR